MDGPRQRHPDATLFIYFICGHSSRSSIGNIPLACNPDASPQFRVFSWNSSRPSKVIRKRCTNRIYKIERRSPGKMCVGECLPLVRGDISLLRFDSRTGNSESSTFNSKHLLLI